MISIASKKNFYCLFMNPNSFLRNSNIHFLFSISIHFFSSSSAIKTLIPNPEIYDVLVNKHHFSPEFASSRLPKFRSPKRVDLVLSFLKENSFTTAQLKKIVTSAPWILGFKIDNLKSRFKVFEDLGISSEGIASIMVQNTNLLSYSLDKKIIPSLSMLQGLMGSNHDVATLLRKSSWFLTSDLEKILLPNVEILKTRGLPMDLILHCLYILPRSFLMKPDIMRKSVDRAVEIGVSRTSAMFLHAVVILGSNTSEGTWEVKVQALRELGFSDDDIFSMFRKQPMAFSASGEKMRKVIELLLDTGKYDISSIVACPTSLGCSITKRLSPRLQILGVLESRNLIEKWPALSTFAKLRDDRFFEQFVKPHCDEIGEEHITRYMSRAKRDEVLEEDAKGTS